MPRLTLADYWMGRDAKYPAELTAEIRTNAAQLVERVNRLLALAAAEGVEPALDEENGSFVASGWRPLFVNDATANSATHSRHITGRAVDLRDARNRRFARWCLTNQGALDEIGLWMEDPRWTPSWVHLQTVPPGSQRRVYVPSTRPPLMAALKEQGGMA